MAQSTTVNGEIGSIRSCDSFCLCLSLLETCTEFSSRCQNLQCGSPSRAEHKVLCFLADKLHLCSPWIFQGFLDYSIDYRRSAHKVGSGASAGRWWISHCSHSILCTGCQASSTASGHYPTRKGNRQNFCVNKSLDLSLLCRPFTWRGQFHIFIYVVCTLSCITIYAHTCIGRIFHMVLWVLNCENKSSKPLPSWSKMEPKQIKKNKTITRYR